MITDENAVRGVMVFQVATVIFGLGENNIDCGVEENTHTVDYITFVRCPL